MKRVAWLTDLHLNFAQPPELQRFWDQLRIADADALLIGGDIGESPDVIGYLGQIDDRAGRPIYFVLGNHDFYHGSIERTRANVAEFCRRRPNLHYLTDDRVAKLSDHVGLAGHDGWADARLGDYAQSDVMMNDYQLIRELSGMTREARLPLLNQLGDEAADHARRVLPAALETFREVIFLTHVPPWHDACWHEGRRSDDEWAPHFTCQALGEALTDIMRGRSDRHLKVLCGHTHSGGQVQPLPNITVLTGAAAYGRPEIQRVLEIE